MLNFEIDIDRNLDAFLFTDSSNYSSLTGDSTNLLITYPIIANEDALTFDIAPELTALGGNAVLFRAANPTLPEIIQGVYSFELQLFDGSNTVPTETKTVYAIDANEILLCRRNLVTALIEECACKETQSWDDVAEINAILEAANYEASQGRFVEAQEMIDYLALKCETIDCSCA